MQGDLDGRDDDLPAQLVLEDALAVAEGAVRGIEREPVARPDAEHLHAADRIAGLAAVGADVLHGSGARLAGNEREILDAPQTAFDGPGDQIVPLDPRLDAQAHLVALVGQQLDAAGHGREQHAVVVLCEEDVVAAGEDRPAVGHPCGEDRTQVVGRFKLDEPPGVLRDAETVAVAQVDVVKFSDHDVQSYEFIY